MSIPYGNSNVLLQGQSSDGGQPSIFQLYQLLEAVGNQQSEGVPPQIQALLDEFSYLFEERSKLPPRRACDHTILWSLARHLLQSGNTDTLRS